jgi:hypothetical protein
MDACVGLCSCINVCPCAGDGQGALYSSSADAEVYLAQQSPDYMGGHAILCHDRCAAASGRGQGAGAGMRAKGVSGGREQRAGA